MGITLSTMEASNRSKRPRKALGDISADVAEAIDSAYAWCTENTGRCVASNDQLKQLPGLSPDATAQEIADEFLADARDYAYAHEPRYVVVGNSTQKGEARFRVELYGANAEVPAA